MKPDARPPSVGNSEWTKKWTELQNAYCRRACAPKPTKNQGRSDSLARAGGDFVDCWKLNGQSGNQEKQCQKCQCSINKLSPRNRISAARPGYTRRTCGPNWTEQGETRHEGAGWAAALWSHRDPPGLGGARERRAKPLSALGAGSLPRTGADLDLGRRRTGTIRLLRRGNRRQSRSATRRRRRS